MCRIRIKGKIFINGHTWVTGKDIAIRPLVYQNGSSTPGEGGSDSPSASTSSMGGELCSPPCGTERASGDVYIHPIEKIKDRFLQYWFLRNRRQSFIMIIKNKRC